MNNVVYINNDPILMELDSSVDRNSTMKMIAFKYFNSDIKLLEVYLKNNDCRSYDRTIELKKIEPKAQLEFSF